MDAYAEIVYVDYQGLEIFDLNPLVFTGLHGPGMGELLPRIVVTDPSSSVRWESVPYLTLRGDKRDQTLHDLKGKIEKQLKTWKQPEPAVPADYIHWPMEDRVVYVGKFVEVADGNLVLKDDDGSFKVPLAKLTDKASTYANELNDLQNAKAKAAKRAALMPQLGIESWISTEGKEIKAAFVGLVGDQISLKTEEGKGFTFALNRLDEVSQSRAKELASQIAIADSAVE